MGHWIIKTFQTEEGEEMKHISVENIQNLLERSMLGSGCTSFA